ncbi:MAG: MHS family MFS transporter [Alphaproteobacteria bacterium]|nr:MHS family MFS transporter [Alphaproteobacteria bacterium]
MRTNSQTPQHITFLASLGSILEYYDFIVYGMMATYLSVVFFPPINPSAAILQSFLVFAVGYFARPLGGTLIGMVGDHWGRRPAFILSTTLMAISTLLIAFLPSYTSMGELTVFLLVAYRIIQGLSFGGELPGAMTIVGEFSPAHRRGRGTSLVVASTSLGALLASGVLYTLSSLLSRQEIINWGWRLPFLGGGILGLFLLFARNRLPETPIFLSLSQESKNQLSFLTLVKKHRIPLLRGALLTGFMAAMVMANLFFPYYIPKYFSYTEKEVYFATTISLIFSATILPSMGLLADIIRNKPLIIRRVCTLYIPLSVPLFTLLSLENMPALIAFLMFQQLVLALYSAGFFPTLIRIFTPDVRYTGIALCYNTMWAVMATLPMMLTSLLNYYATPWCVPVVLSVIAGLSYLAAWGIRKEPDQEMNEDNEIKETRYDLAG